MNATGDNKRRQEKEDRKNYIEKYTERIRRTRMRKKSLKIIITKR